MWLTIHSQLFEIDDAFTYFKTMLKQAHQLSSQDLQALGALLEQCKHYDGHVIPVYAHLLTRKRTLPSLLYYQDQQLIGFLSAFGFYENACELALMVAPSVRKQGIARAMLLHMLPILATLQLNTVIFSSIHSTHKPWFNKNQFAHLKSEFEMVWDIAELPETDESELQVFQASEVDIPFLCSIDSLCFPEQSMGQNNMVERFLNLLNDDTYTIFLARHAGIPIGKAHIHWLANSAQLTDIAILPKEQRQGHGSELLRQCIRYIRTMRKTPITLNVETRNQHALNIYTNLGFIITNICDYWSIQLNNLLKKYNIS